MADPRPHRRLGLLLLAPVLLLWMVSPNPRPARTGPGAPALVYRDHAVRQSVMTPLVFATGAAPTPCDQWCAAPRRYAAAPRDTVQAARRRLPAPQIIYFFAQPDRLRPGEFARLYWRTRYASRVEISGIAQVEPAGSLRVQPRYTTRYTLSATAPGRPPARHSVRIRIIGPDLALWDACVQPHRSPTPPALGALATP